MRSALRQISALLTRRQRLGFAGLVALMSLMALADLAGVALILPFLAIVANPAVIETRPRLSALYDWTGVTDPMVFLQILGAVVFVAVMAAIGLRALTFYRVTLFARGATMSLGAALLHRYLSRPYVWFLRQHSADLGKTILQEVHDVAMGAIAPAIRALANVLVLIGLFALLVAIEPLGATVMFLFLGAAFAGIYGRLDRMLVDAGADRRTAKREKHQITAEAMTGIKEVKVMGLEDAYLRRFLDPSERVARHQAMVALMGQMPRHAIEALTFGGMLLFVIWLLYSRGGRIEDALPVIGAFAFAGLRLMPTLQQLFHDVALLRHTQPTLAAFSAEIGPDDLEAWRRPGPAAAAEDRIRLTRELRLDGATYRYPGADHDAIAGLDLAIGAGQSVGIVGASGAGKTTALDILLGLIAPDAGGIEVDGQRIGPDRIRAWQRGIGYVPQAIYLVDDTIAANVAFGLPPDRIDRAQVARAARLAHLDAFVGTLPDGYDTLVGEAGVRLSGGQRQRIGIARALYRDPDLVVFDEATSALDSVTERAVIDAVQGLKGRMTVVMVTHRLATVAQCDRILVLSNGRLVGAGDHATLAAANPAYRALLKAADAPKERSA